MRAYGRVTDRLGNRTWVVVETDANGDSSYVYVTALAQCFKLNLNESPFWANFGIPAKNSVVQQIAPDFYVQKIVSYFTQYFPAISVAKQSTSQAAPEPIYNVSVMRANGSIYQTQIGV